MMGERPLDLAVGDVRARSSSQRWAVVSKEAHGGGLAPLLQASAANGRGDAGVLDRVAARTHGPGRHRRLT